MEETIPADRDKPILVNPRELTNSGFPQKFKKGRGAQVLFIANISKCVVHLFFFLS